MRHAPRCGVLGRPDMPAYRGSLRPCLAARAACHPSRSLSGQTPSALYARSRGGDHVSPTDPPSSCLCGGTSRFAHAPSTRSSRGDRAMSALVELDGVVVRYGPAVAVAGVSLHIGARERVALIGPNGAGKSSL